MSISPTGSGFPSTTGTTTPAVTRRPSQGSTGATFTLAQEAKPATPKPAPVTESPGGNAPGGNKGRGQLVNIVV